MGESEIRGFLEDKRKKGIDKFFSPAEIQKEIQIGKVRTSIKKLAKHGFVDVIYEKESRPYYRSNSKHL